MVRQLKRKRWRFVNMPRVVALRLSKSIETRALAARDSRPALDRLMKDARARKFDVVIVARFDRFARSVSHLLRALEEFNHLGIDFVSLWESIDTSISWRR